MQNPLISKETHKRGIWRIRVFFLANIVICIYHLVYQTQVLSCGSIVWPEGFLTKGSDLLQAAFSILHSKFEKLLKSEYCLTI